MSQLVENALTVMPSR